MVPFRTFREPLFPKPVTGQELFLAISYSKPALIVEISYELTVLIYIYCANRIKHIFQNITIEPASFLISFSTQMDDVSLSQMTIYKTCRENYNETVCDDSNLVNNFTDVNDEVQGEAST